MLEKIWRAAAGKCEARMKKILFLFYPNVNVNILLNTLAKKFKKDCSNTQIDCMQLHMHVHARADEQHKLKDRRNINHTPLYIYTVNVNHPLIWVSFA